MIYISHKVKRVAILAGPEYEDLELHYPLLRLKEAGFDVKVIALTKDPVKGKHGLTVKPDLTFTEAKPEEFDCVVIPGGWAPDTLRRYKEVLDFVKNIAARGIVAAICHGPQILISAGLLKGKRITCVSAIKDDVINAGAEYLNEPVVVDGNMITSRIPPDLPYFCQEIIKALQKE